MPTLEPRHSSAVHLALYLGSDRAEGPTNRMGMRKIISEYTKFPRMFGLYASSFLLEIISKILSRVKRSF